MLLRRIIGFILLIGFLSFLVIKFNATISHLDHANEITFLAVVILLIILLFIRRILNEGY